MKQKIVMNVPMHREKDRSKAMKIAVAVQGVISVNVGVEKDRLEVTGEGVDSVYLANSLRKKFSYADIVTVEDMTQTTDPSPQSSPTTKPSPPPWQPQYPYPPPGPPVYYEARYYDAGPPNCSVL